MESCVGIQNSQARRPQERAGAGGQVGRSVSVAGEDGPRKGGQDSRMSPGEHLPSWGLREGPTSQDSVHRAGTSE